MQKKRERWLIWSYLCSCKFVLHVVSKAPNDNIIVKFQETWMPKRKPKKKIEVRYVLCFEAISDLGVNLSKSVMVLFGSVSDVSNLISLLRMPSYDLYDYL